MITYMVNNDNNNEIVGVCQYQQQTQQVKIFLFARCLLSRKFVPRRRGDETGPAADLHAQAQGQNDGPQR